jgi:alpha-L-fucosidase
MKRILVIFTAFILFTTAASAQKKLTRDERMKWWREARFGMFIHWGDYALWGGMYKGHKVAHGGE